MKKYALLFLSVLVIPCIVFAQKQIEISNFYAKVYLAPNNTSRFIGLAQKGEVYPVLNENGSWYQIQFKVSMGWVNTSDAKPYDPNAKVAETVDSSTNVAQADSQAQDSLQSGIATNTAPTTDTGSPTASSEARSNNRSSQASTYQGSQTGSSSSKTEEKAPSKIRDWFTKQNPFNIEPATEIQGEAQKVEYYQVVLGPTRIIQYLDPSAPLLGMAKKGESFELIGRGDSWCKIVFGDSVGWIETKNGKVVDAPDDVILTDLTLVGICVGIILLLVVIVAAILKFTRKKNDVKEIAVKKNVLFVAKTGKNIQNTFEENTVSLDKCFAEIGFKVKIVKDTNSIYNYLNEALPDVVMADWNFDRNAIGIVERTFFNIKRVNEILIIMYNVPDPSSMPPSHVLPQIKFLGISFSDRDIFKLVTPQISDKNSYYTKKSVNSSALEGENNGENLLEVLQYIETGRKTGCILVETDRPFGLIYFYMGRINYAATSNGVKDKDAVFLILNLKQGKFRFVLNKKPKRSTINLSTLEVLMEWTKALDEANGN